MIAVVLLATIGGNLALALVVVAVSATCVSTAIYVLFRRLNWLSAAASSAVASIVAIVASIYAGFPFTGFSV